MDLDLRLVRYFVAVASELHFGRAAAQLFVSQPALSKQIKKLETQVGEPLLVRDSRHVSLTPRGERFYDEAQQLLAMADRLQRPATLPGHSGGPHPRARDQPRRLRRLRTSLPRDTVARACHGQ